MTDAAPESAMKRRRTGARGNLPDLVIKAVLNNDAAGRQRSGIAHPNGISPAAEIFAASGTVRDPTGAPLPGTAVAMSFNGGPTRIVMADAAGIFSLPVLADGCYTIWPTLYGYMFTPSNRSVSTDGASVTDLDFVGALPARGPRTTASPVSGMARNPVSLGVGEVTIKSR